MITIPFSFIAPPFSQTAMLWDVTHSLQSGFLYFNIKKCQDCYIKHMVKLEDTFSIVNKHNFLKPNLN